MSSNVVTAIPATPEEIVSVGYKKTKNGWISFIVRTVGEKSVTEFHEADSRMVAEEAAKLSFVRNLMDVSND